MRIRFRALTANNKQINTHNLLNKASHIQREWATKVVKRLQNYPAPPAGSLYQRTYALRNGWRINGPASNASGLITTITNATPYAAGVHGDTSGNNQWRIHQGRWILIPDAIDRNAYLSALRQLFKTLGV